MAGACGRSACLTPATSTVGLDPRPFSDYSRSRMVTFGEDVIDLAERHPSGCDFFCVPDGVLDGHRLRLHIGELRRFYDLIFIDCPPGAPRDRRAFPRPRPPLR